jgi:hypothetical protein
MFPGAAGKGAVEANGLYLRARYILFSKVRGKDPALRPELQFARDLVRALARCSLTILDRLVSSFIRVMEAERPDF